MTKQDCRLCLLIRHIPIVNVVKQTGAGAVAYGISCAGPYSTGTGFAMTCHLGLHDGMLGHQEHGCRHIVCKCAYVTTS
jgi:hypothetical protein